MSDTSLFLLVGLMVAMLIVTLVRQRAARDFTSEQKAAVVDALRAPRTVMLIAMTATMVAVAVAFSRRAYEVGLQLEAVTFVMAAATVTVMFFRVRRLALPAAYIALWGLTAAVLSLGMAGIWISLRYAG
jgi:hypothetical protein